MADPDRSIEPIEAHNDNDAESSVKVGKCPLCNQPGKFATRPFCSTRCADVDLGRWMTGRYAIPVEEDDDEDGQLGMQHADGDLDGES